MLRSVKLDRLPDDLSFPEKLVDRISYDASSRELRFHGFMSKVDFDKLVHLHNDIDYQRALERLFQICTFEPEPSSVGTRSSIRLFVAGATAAIAVIAITAFFLVG
ncbi:MAG TPA: hypothetical protein VMM76_27730 [Pirellulaceae bacterium]|nr:hypothetical protein [Pirellulaceae bacterium]